MTDTEAISRIQWAISSLPAKSGTWLDSIPIQLQYCADLLHGRVGPDRVEEINMGYIAVREFDGYEKGSEEFELTEVICEIDYYVKSRFFTYAQKVKHGMHKR
ncbi:MAG: hypothetical protein EPO06_11465 [Burkholderiaceae bacterium]|nr:MAG: hypothetical protein EPO06_11465 [Burkholderiaceae bacterium]